MEKDPASQTGKNNHSGYDTTECDTPYDSRLNPIPKNTSDDPAIMLKKTNRPTDRAERS